LTPIAFIDTGDDLDEGRLPAAILADQAVNLAWLDGQIYAAQGSNTGERLVDVSKAKQFFSHGRGIQLYR
jgi:hypothetical protein